MRGKGTPPGTESIPISSFFQANYYRVKQYTPEKPEVQHYYDNTRGRNIEEVGNFLLVGVGDYHYLYTILEFGLL